MGQYITWCRLIANRPFSLNKWCNNLVITLYYALRIGLMSSSYSTVSGYPCKRFNLLWLPKSRQGGLNELVFTVMGIPVVLSLVHFQLGAGREFQKVSLNQTPEFLLWGLPTNKLISIRWSYPIHETGFHDDTLS